MDSYSAFAFKNNDGSVELWTVNESPEEVRDQMLQDTMGWRYNHSDKYPHEQKWAQLLETGKVVEVVVTVKEKEE
jgi:hypothetical protein